MLLRVQIAIKIEKCCRVKNVVEGTSRGVRNEGKGFWGYVTEAASMDMGDGGVPSRHCFEFGSTEPNPRGTTANWGEKKGTPGTIEREAETEKDKGWEGRWARGKEEEQFSVEYCVQGPQGLCWISCDQV